MGIPGGPGLECHLCRVQVTLCDPIWHVSSSSGVAALVSKLLYPCCCYFTWSVTIDLVLLRFKNVSCRSVSVGFAEKTSVFGSV